MIGLHPFDGKLKAARFQLCHLSIVIVVAALLSACAHTSKNADAGTEIMTFTSVKGTQYQVSHMARAPDTDSNESTVGLMSSRSGCTRWGDAGHGPEAFNGCARRAAKTSLVSIDDAPGELYEDGVRALRTDIGFTDAQMRAADFDIPRGANGTRTNREERNVVVDAYLVAVSFESDRDYHLILREKTCQKPSCLMTAEVGGLPIAGNDLAILAEARETFQVGFGDVLPNSESDPAVIFKPPVPVRVHGSLFYDIDHKPGAVGPGKLKPNTAWEIHPVREIEIEPE